MKGVGYGKVKGRGGRVGEEMYLRGGKRKKGKFKKYHLFDRVLPVILPAW